MTDQEMSMIMFGAFYVTLSRTVAGLV